MPTIPLHPPDPSRKSVVSSASNPLPQLLQTPSGLALIELQGTINLPEPASLPSNNNNPSAQSQDTPIGRLVFPDHEPNAPADDLSWTKQVYLYVGKHQRLTGEVKKLPNPMAIIRKRDVPREEKAEADTSMDERDEVDEELEIVEIVKWKILFSQRPEPVGS
ncbi:MAG: hypothetical protein M1817_002555 [Caeruleum heppii]|nr:MAG: hypothetical protein M1817_002555 [Caeruleum heppii]